MPRSRRELDVQNTIRLAIGSLPDVRLWRNNVGELKDERGIPVKYGLAVGSADTIGIVAPRARLLSLEIKLPGYKPSGAKERKREEDQQAWRDIVNRFGGIALRVDSAEQALWGVALARHDGVRLSDGTIFPADLFPELSDEWQQLIDEWHAKKGSMGL